MQAESQKHKLKQEAKSLLLKGCYKMANNKYKTLIDLGGEGFTQRQWSIINLNKAISLQFLEKYEQALEWATNSIKVDPTYQKAHYRRMQILRELGRLQQALQSVPSWVKNKQLEDLHKQIHQEYYNSLGIDKIIENILAQKQATEIKKELFTKFYQRLAEQLQKGQKNGLVVVGQKMAQCYSYLKELGNHQSLQSFLSIIYLLLVKNDQKADKKNLLHQLLQSFWANFTDLAQPFKNKQISKLLLKEKQEYKLIKFVPNSVQILNFLQIWTKSDEIINSQEVFEFILQVTHRMCSKQKLAYNGSLIHQIVQNIVVKIQKHMNHKFLGWLNHSFLLIDSLIKLHLYFQTDYKIQTIDCTSLFYLRFYYLNRNKDSKQQNSFVCELKTEKICEWLITQLQNFTAIYVAQQFIHHMDKNKLSPLLTAIEQQIEMFSDLKQIHKAKESQSKNIVLMSREYELIYTSLMLKIDLKHSISKVNIKQLLSYKHNREQLADQTMSDIAINTMLLLAVSSSSNLLQIISHPHTITEIIHSFIKQPQNKKIEHISITINFIYLVLTDMQLMHEQNYAKKMGVTIQEIHKVRKLQGQAQKPELAKQLTLKRNKLREYISKNWIQTLLDLSKVLLKIKEETLLTKWANILSNICQIDSSRFHNTTIIEVMLQAFKYEKTKVGVFFSTLCKQINSELLKYEQFQSVANVLLYNIENGDHQLVIFQSLLGLINLTSNTNHHLKIPIKPLQNSLMQENKYIVHGSLELLNNILVYYDKEEINKLKKLTQIIQKYIAFYRQEVVSNQEEVPLGDYSHPSKIYATLLSLAIVIDLEAIEEFKDWQKSKEALLKLESSRAITLFKVAIYMHSKEKIKGKWWSPFQKDIAELQKLDRGRWMKLKQYMK